MITGKARRVAMIIYSVQPDHPFIRMATIESIVQQTMDILEIEEATNDQD